jgi:hypothetical protein
MSHSFFYISVPLPQERVIDSWQGPQHLQDIIVWDEFPRRIDMGIPHDPFFSEAHCIRHVYTPQGIIMQKGSTMCYDME